MAGYEILLGIDNKEEPLETFAHNHNNSKIFLADMSKIDSSSIKTLIKGQEIDVLVGGPPCQGFSLAGKRQANDSRNKLVIDYLEKVTELRPSFFVLENVIGLLSMKNENDELVINELLKSLIILDIKFPTRSFILTITECPKKDKDFSL